MRWLKRNRWKAGIALAGLLLLVLMVWIPASAGAYGGASGLATPVTGTAQATATEDATVTALNKEKLAQEVQQLKNQNEQDFFGWLQMNAALLLSTLVVVIGGLIGLFRWFADRQAERERRAEEQGRWQKDREAEREKRAEERFQSVVTGLGSKKEEARVGAAIMLRTFLQPGYEQFYRQAFDLAVAHLRLRPADPNTSASLDPTEYVPVDSLSQALITVFKESFPLARNALLDQKQSAFDTQMLDASRIRLDYAFLARSDLKGVLMRGAFLIGTNLRGADLREALLNRADLRGVNLPYAKLSKARFYKANLSKADLERADLREADLRGAILTATRLNRADLTGAKLKDAELNGAELNGADLRGVKGLTKEQLEVCKAKGAIIDEDTTTSPPQSPASPSPPAQSNDTQTPPSSTAQVNTPLPDTDGSSLASSQPNQGA
jgi:uncharacterized protein YjbI with pentapeptide repeats